LAANRSKESIVLDLKTEVDWDVLLAGSHSIRSKAGPGGMFTKACDYLLVKTPTIDRPQIFVRGIVGHAPSVRDYRSSRSTDRPEDFEEIGLGLRVLVTLDDECEALLA
jgi:hypothetical protein